ncbi:hypothetical protein L0337_18250 [candidate division KSB1 bacterium]|nr:hypothetical protein [candidate division KSB1 bacterium]
MIAHSFLRALRSGYDAYITPQANLWIFERSGRFDARLHRLPSFPGGANLRIAHAR